MNKLMKKRLFIRINAIFISFMLIFVGYACNQTKNEVAEENEGFQEDDKEKKVSSKKEAILQADNLPKDENQTSDSQKKDENQQSDKNGNFIKLYSYSENADMKNDEDLSESMRTLINSSSEEEFIAMFLDDNESKTIVENSVYKMEMGELGDKNSIVFIIKNEEHEYPQIAYGLSYYESKVKNEAIISETVPGADSSGTKLDIFERIKALDGTEYWGIDFLKPLNAYQDISYIRDNEGKLIKAEYSSDSQIYGSYNSEGVLYYDADENPELKRYYTTGGTRYMAYVYDENKLIMICDFGGNPYKSLDDNPNIELGMDFKIYFLQ